MIVTPGSNELTAEKLHQISEIFKEKHFYNYFCYYYYYYYLFAASVILIKYRKYYNILNTVNNYFPAEIQSVKEQLSEGGKSSRHEVEKIRRKLGLENEELQAALEEAEAALEQEESKLLKVQLELTQLKQTSERRLSEKDEELESLRKKQQRQLQALQNTIDSSQKTKVEVLKIRKKNDIDVAELESRLDM